MKTQWMRWLVQGVLALCVLVVSSQGTVALAQANAASEYPDVPSGHWAFEAVSTLSSNGFIEGRPNGNYAGAQAMTRCEFAVGLLRWETCSLFDVGWMSPARIEERKVKQEAMRLKHEAMKVKHATLVPQVRGADPIEYPDVPRGHWGYESISQLSQQGILLGLPNGTFGTTKALTRFEGALALARWVLRRSSEMRFAERLQKLEEEQQPVAREYHDVPQAHWAFPAVSYLSQTGLLHGFSNGLFRGEQPMTRFEFAFVMARIRPLARMD